MLNNNSESLFEIIKATAIEVLEVSDEAASSFARIATARATCFYLRFDNIPGSLILKDVTYDGRRFIAEWESVSTRADCPECGKTSVREHSSHLFCEMVQDVGVSGIGLWHKVRRKKYVCANDHCVHKIFLEGFPGFIEARRARMTVEFAEHVLSAAVNTSSRAAAKMLRAQGAEISRDTVNRVVLRRGAKQIERNFYDEADKVVNAGIDDINLRKGDGETSCMVIVDLDTGKLLGIVRGTTGEAAKQALAMFPNLDIVSRDRGTAMASAAQALGKTSVADRFHITANMHDAIERTLHETLPASVYIPVGDAWVCLSSNGESGEIVAASMPASLTGQDIRLRVRMAHLGAKAEQTYRDTLRVLELTMQGRRAGEISDIMGVPVEKVRKLRSGMRETISNAEKKIDEFVADPYGSVKRQKSVTTSAEHSSKSKVEPYRETVVAMRKEGKGHMAIYKEICRMGFEGSHSTVDNYIIKLGREGSIDREIMLKRSVSHDWLGSMPARPGRISVRVYSAKTVYKRVLAKIRECRPANAGKEQDPDGGTAGDAPAGKKKPGRPRQRTG